ncbi:MAG: hypothetical protein IJO29_06500 [Oscillospiraceae bacterium]|nr:hypothetical protein [Oscillospiraceae bacterium]
MKSFKARFALSFSVVFALSIALLNLVESFANEKLTFNGAFFGENLNFACVVRVLLFAVVIVLSVCFARLATRLAAAFSVKSDNADEDHGKFLDVFYIFVEIAFLAYVALRLYFGVRALNVTSTAFLIMGINDFTFVLMLMRIFTYIANIIYALGGVCALAGCAGYAKQLIDKTTKKETD